MPIKIGDQQFCPEDIEGIRQAVMSTRDAAIETGRFEHAVPLSHAISLLAHLRDQPQSK